MSKVSMNSKQELEVQRIVIINYLTQKTKFEDWHAVADAAMDLRDIDAKLELIEMYTGEAQRAVDLKTQKVEHLDNYDRQNQTIKEANARLPSTLLKPT